jgi:dTDP-4-amino-4,6-dideoxygalactose transaminase
MIEGDEVIVHSFMFLSAINVVVYEDFLFRFDTWEMELR